MKLIAIRHTRVAVPPGICYGQTDVPLANSYSEELEHVKTTLAGQAFDAVYCSPLTRCQTLAMDLFPTEDIRFDKRLVELNFGMWEMQDWDTISKMAEAQKWFDDFVEVRCAGGESFLDQINRTMFFLEELAQKPYRQAAMVTHGGILRALNCLLNATAPIDAFQTNVEYGQVLTFDLNSFTANR
ncbi:alpha-ribazole phosphatase [Sunxiuqinia sp. sy24]|uniref:alpha-ribazole phosphatase n=1 Tax=Sunxiuqinia sp. sy24 TaxID=3461495 RepID=UPI004045D4D9